MNRKKGMLTVLALLMILSLTFTSAGAIAPADEGVSPDFEFDDPEPYYPAYEAIYDKTPTFEFSQYEDVTRYRIKVRNSEDQNITYYTYIGKAICNDYCELTPDIRLAGGVVTFEKPLKGHYEWTVEAKLGPGLWSGVQDYVPFGLGASRISSLFTLNKNGWVDRNGTWSVTPAGLLKNKAIAGEYTSTLNSKKVLDNFTYTVRMKLKSVDSGTHYGGVIFNGNGDLIDPTDPFLLDQKQVWNWASYFLYKNNKQAAIYIWDGGSIVDGVSWRECASIIPGGWNVIEVTTENDTVYVNVNGEACMDLPHPSIADTGYIGLTQYHTSTEIETMLVDWVKLEVDTP